MDFLLALNALRNWFLVHRNEMKIKKTEFGYQADVSRSDYHKFESTQLPCDFGMLLFLKICYHHRLKPWVVLELALRPVWKEKD